MLSNLLSCIYKKAPNNSRQHFLSFRHNLYVYTWFWFFGRGVITFQRFFSLTLREIFQPPLFSWPHLQEHAAELTLPVIFLEHFCSRVSKCCFSLIFTPFGYRTSDPRGTPWDIFQKDRLNQLSWRKSANSVPTLLIILNINNKHILSARLQILLQSPWGDESQMSQDADGLSAPEAYSPGGAAPEIRFWFFGRGVITFQRFFPLTLREIFQSPLFPDRARRSTRPNSRSPVNFLELFCSRVSKCCFSLIFTPFGYRTSAPGRALGPSFKKIDSTNYHGGRALTQYLLCLLY